MLRYTLYPVTPDDGLAVQFSNTEWALPAATVMLNDWVAACAVGAVESVTFAVKLNDPAVVGVPEIVPLAAASVRPAGNAPELMFQL